MASIDVLRSRITVASTAVEVRGNVTLGNEPKTSRSKRTVPVARSVMRRLEEHPADFVGPHSDALVFTAPRGGPLARSLFSRRVWQPAVIRAGIPRITFHGLRQALWRSWWPLDATSTKSRNWPATTASRLP
jgi:integrase